MARYIVRRLLTMALTMFVVSILVFAIVEIAPGNVARNILGAYATHEQEHLGLIVEIGPCESIYAPPNHPYTAALLAAVPRPDPDAQLSKVRISGRVPSAINPPNGCRFNTRCPFKIGAICENEEPPLQEMGGATKFSVTGRSMNFKTSDNITRNQGYTYPNAHRQTFFHA